MTVMDQAVGDERADRRMQDLERAWEIRARRRDLKRRITNGTETAYAILLAPPEYVLTMKVEELLRAVPGVGKIRAAKIMRGGAADFTVSPSARIGDLGEQTRWSLADRVEHYDRNFVA